MDGDISKAKTYYKICIEKGFDDPRVFSNYGLILKGQGNLEQAELLYRQAIKFHQC